MCGAVKPYQPAVVRTSTSGTRRTFTWELAPHQFYNAALVMAEREGEEDPFGETSVSFRALPNNNDLPRLHILALAANGYAIRSLQLKFPIADATSIIEVLGKESADLYRPGVIKRVFEDKLTRAGLDLAISELQEAIVQSDTGDLLVVFIAGHGVAVEDMYYFVPPDPSLTDLQQTDVIKRIGISWTQLQQLAEIPCRKLVMLDTCHSGNILLSENQASHMKAAIRSLKQKQMLVFAATDAHQLAIEVPTYGHGLFTKCVLDGLAGKADTAQDGEVDFREIVSYVKGEVRQLTTLLSNRQTPRSTPDNLLQSMVFVPLVRYPKSE